VKFWTFALVTCCVFAAALRAQRADFRIVVFEGKDATNVIQPRTAVAPVIEVREVVCLSTLEARGALNLTLAVASNDTVTGTGENSMVFVPVSQTGCPVQQGASGASFKT